MILKSRSNAVSITDWLALVGGAALASVHFRRLDFRADRNLLLWAPVWLLFALVSTTAAGPLVLASRTIQNRRFAGTPMIGEVLWAILGVPWVLAGLLRITQTSYSNATPSGDELYILVLATSIALGCLIVLGLLWVRWVRAPSAVIEARDGPISRSWSNRVGFVLAIAWPVQCGAGLFVASG